MRARMPVLRRIAAAHVPALQAHAQMHPRVARLQALLATLAAAASPSSRDPSRAYISSPCLASAGKLAFTPYTVSPMRGTPSTCAATHASSRPSSAASSRATGSRHLPSLPVHSETAPASVAPAHPPPCAPSPCAPPTPPPPRYTASSGCSCFAKLRLLRQRANRLRIGAVDVKRRLAIFALRVVAPIVPVDPQSSSSCTPHRAAGPA